MSYGLQSIGLRYFNVFGRRQDPAGAYAAVIPRWIASLLRGERCRIFGDGETTRDFCHVANVIQANLLAATVNDVNATGQAFKVQMGKMILTPAEKKNGKMRPPITATIAGDEIRASYVLQNGSSHQRVTLTLLRDSSYW